MQGNEIVIVGAVWIVSGLLAYSSCLADFYQIGLKYPRLGTGDEQWNGTGWAAKNCGAGPDRNDALPIAVMVGVMGPLGFIFSAICTKGFRSGFRFW